MPLTDINKKLQDIDSKVERIDERSTILLDNMESVKEDNRTRTELVDMQLNSIRNEIGILRTSIKNDYISKIEFNPIQKIVYGLVGLILTAIGLTILKAIALYHL